MTAATPLPCPFCGQELTLISEIELRDYPGIWRQLGPDTWAIRVPADGCPHCSHVLIDRPAKMAAWNRRVPAWGPPRPMAEAPRDRQRVLLLLKDPIPRDRKDLRDWDGVPFVGQHIGVQPDRLDIGWQFAAPVGQGGYPDDWFAGWWPLPETRG